MTTLSPEAANAWARLEELNVYDLETCYYGSMGWKASGYKMPGNRKVEGSGKNEEMALKDLLNQLQKKKD